MTMWAPSDIQSVNVSEGHNGCGSPHVRDTDDDGNPVRHWGVTCTACEEFLRADGRWADRPDDVGPTYDERLETERMEKNAGRSQLRMVEQAAGLLALLAGPRELLAGQVPALAAPAASCRKCSAPAPDGARFCGECGSPVLRQVEGVVA